MAEGRACWQRGGARHCRSYRGGRTYGYRNRTGNGNGDADYYVHDADKLPIGTARWWDQMQRENGTRWSRPKLSGFGVT